METTINGARIHYERAGEGLPVIFLHAGVADSRMWEPQLKAFAKHFDVITPDMRGFGKSELPPVRWSPVKDIASLMDELHLKPAHVVGCSIGARVAIDFALDHAERISDGTVVNSSLSVPRLITLGNSQQSSPSEGRVPPQLEICRACDAYIWPGEESCPHCGACIREAAETYAADNARREAAMAEVRRILESAGAPIS